MSSCVNAGHWKGFERIPQTCLWSGNTYLTHVTCQLRIGRENEIELTSFWCSREQKNIQLVPWPAQAEHRIVVSFWQTTHGPGVSELDMSCWPGEDWREEEGGLARKLLQQLEEGQSKPRVEQKLLFTLIAEFRHSRKAMRREGDSLWWNCSSCYGWRGERQMTLYWLRRVLDRYSFW